MDEQVFRVGAWVCDRRDNEIGVIVGLDRIDDKCVRVYGFYGKHHNARHPRSYVRESLFSTKVLRPYTPTEDERVFLCRAILSEEVW